MNVVQEILRLIAEAKLPEAEALMARTGIDRDQKPPSLYLQGYLAFAKDDLRTAKVKFSRAVKAAPHSLPPLIGLGNAYVKLGDFKGALRAFKEAEAIAPSDPAVLGNIGLAYRCLGQLDRAQSYLESTLARDPENTPALLNLAAVLEHLNDFRGAITLLMRCPQTAENLTTQAHLHRRLGDAESERATRQQADALNADPNLDIIRQANEALASGDLGMALRLRAKVLPDPLPKIDLPFWDGLAPERQHVVVHCEQGLGDTVQYARFLPRLAERVAALDVIVPPALTKLLSTLPGRQRIIGSLAEAGEATCWCSTLNIPGLLDISEEAALWSGPYLAAEPHRVEKWRRRLPDAALRIGVVWQGRAWASVDVGRSFSATSYAELAAIPGVALISLQKTDGKTAVPNGLPIHVLKNFDDGPDAFLDTAAVISQLDLVITSDTSVAHVAGALGVPTWLQLQSDPDRRWLKDRSDTPWYPSMRLFRQPTPGDWASVHKRVAEAVSALLAERGAAA